MSVKRFKLFIYYLKPSLGMTFLVMAHFLLLLLFMMLFLESAYSAGIKTADYARGKAVYERYCIGCHGENGDGNGEYAKGLNPKPRNFTSGIFKWTSGPAGSMPTDLDLMMTITEGVYGTSMPPWGALKETEKLNVISYIKSFSNRFEKSLPSEGTFIYPPPPKTPELIQKGKIIYKKTGCDRCHGLEGKGDGVRAINLMDDWENPILPTDFYHGIIKTGPEDWKIYRTIANGMGGTPMPSSVDQLKPNEIWALVYYIRSLKH